MKKKISVGTFAVSLLAAVLVSVLTCVVVYTSKLNTLIYDMQIEYGFALEEKVNEVKEYYGEAVTKFDKLYELDNVISQLFIGNIDYEKLIDMILTGYMVGTGDKYGGYYTAEEMEELLSDIDGELVGIGVQVIHNADVPAIEIITVMPNSPALEAGLLPGDLIVAIGIGDNAETVAELGYEIAVNKVRGEIGTKAELTVLRDGEYIEFSIERAKVVEQTVMSHVYELDNTVGVIKLTGFDKKTFEQFKTAVEALEADGCTSIVVDVRDNPGGELGAICDVLNYLLPEGPIVRTIDKAGNEQVVATSDKSMNDIPLTVIVNGNTASAAELFASALQDYDRATVIGTQTYGKGSMQTIQFLSDGSGYRVTYRYYCPPFSPNYDGVGVTPDIVEELDEALENKNPYKITDAEDNQLRRAVEALNK